jgi:diguanylate cyclase (GGDEF)-like protein
MTAGNASFTPVAQNRWAMPISEGGRPMSRRSRAGARASRGSIAARLPVLAAAAAAGPSLCLSLALLLAGKGDVALWLALAALPGAAGAAFVAARLLQPLGRLARSVAPRGPETGHKDEVERIADAVAALVRRLDAATRRGDPARLDDPLTGLPNRLSVMRRGRDEITRARRKGTGLSLALFAVDGADLERLGPVEGDRSLRICGEVLSQSLRAYDVVGRWDAAVFAALMPEAEVENAVEAMLRVRAQIAAAPPSAAPGHRLNCHAGVAVLQPDDATLADMAARASAALDRARSGPGAPVQAAPGPRMRPATLTSV